MACEQVINSALSQKNIDGFMAIYLYNLAYQMVREGLGEDAMRVYSRLIFK